MERVEAHATAEQPASRLGRILDASSDEIFVFDAETLRLLQANKGARLTLGYEGAELTSLTLPDILPELPPERFQATIAPLRSRTREQVVLETVHRRKDGGSYPIEVRLQLAASEQPPVIVAIVTEIGERRAFEAALKCTNRAMTVLTRATQAMIHATDAQRLLEEVCRIAVDVGGYRLAWVGWAHHDEAKSVEPAASCGDGAYLDGVRISWAEDDECGRGPTGLAIRTRTPQISRDTATDQRFSPWRDAALRHGFGSTVALPLVVQDEVIGAFNLYAAEPDAFDADELHLVEDLARNLAYGITMLHADAQRRRAEAELKESEERYRALVEMSPDGILAFRNRRVVFANDAANRIYRVPCGETLIGRDALDLLPPARRTGAGARFKQALVPARPIEEQMQRLDGEIFAAEVMASEIAYHGLQTRLVVVRDITDRKRVEDQLIQADKLATLGEMAAGMAHELSQPLNVIRMASEGALMLIGRGRATDDYKQKQFELIAGQTHRMAEIIDQIRIFSRKDTGAIEIFDAAEAVRLAVELFDRHLRGGTVTMDVKLPDRPCPVLGRPVQLEQVVMNLMSNAVDAIREKRREPGCEALPGRIEVFAAATDEQASITVRDNGTGIPREARERIFEPFFTTKEIGRGTGLGLSVSFGIISSMSGRIDAFNGKEGASFVVTLPLAKSACRAAPPPAPDDHGDTRPIHHPAAADHHLLVVDDESVAAQAMAAYLREWGYRVSTAINGVEAWQLFQADPAELVITDLRMPKGNGRELIGRLRQHDPLLPIIVVTGHMGPTEKLSEEVGDELAVIMHKPVSLQSLAETVGQFLLT